MPSHRSLFPNIGHFLDASESPRMGFVGGQGKSGTTWVQLLLDAHPRVSALGEGHLAEGLAARVMRALAEYRDALQKNNRYFPELPDFPLPDDGDALELARAALLLQFRKLADRKPQASVLVDRTPGDIAFISELSELFPGAKFVHVLRDPRDIAVSLWWHGNRLEPGRWQREAMTPTRLAQEVTAQWAAMIRHTRATVISANIRMHELRYEDLHARSGATATELFEFLEVDSTPAVVDAAIAAARFEQISGRDPGRTDASSHFRAGRPDAWRQSLTDWDSRQLSDSARELIEELGYRAD